MATQRLVMALLLSSAAALSGCGRNEAVRAVSAANAAPVAKPTSNTADYYESSGPLLVEDQVDVAAQREGLVAKIAVEVGDRVKKGEVLAQLDDRQLLAERDAAQADLKASAANLKNWQAESKVLEADMRRDEELWKAQLVTQQQLEHSRYKFEAARFQAERDEHNQVFFQAKLRSIELELEKTRILAPFGGVVARRYVRMGQKVATNDKLFWVTAMSPISVKFTLPQEFAGHIRTGELVTVSAVGSPDRRHEAKVSVVSPVVDPGSGMIEVQARLMGTPPDLLPGMTVAIRVPRTR